MAGFVYALRDSIDAALVALFPPHCGGCKASLVVRPEFGLCQVCVEVLETNVGNRCQRCDVPNVVGTCADCRARPPAYSVLRAPWVYGGPIADLVVDSKFSGREDLASAAGRMLAADETARSLALGTTAVVPVPLGAGRRRRRGYNQSAIIARRLARAWGVPVRYALKRRTETAPQSDLPLVGRRANVSGVFTASSPVDGPVLLVDDVVTSGETVREAANALLSAGASEVRVVALARAPL